MRFLIDDDETDEALMVRAQGDDDVAFAVLHGRYSDYAFRVARAICHDGGRAEDAVQEGFLSIWRSRGDYRPQIGTFQAWSMRIVRHRAIDSFRAVGGRPPLQGAGSEEESLEVDDGASPLSRVIAASERSLMLDSLRQLPMTQAEVVVLAFYGDLSQAEVAKRIGLPIGTVKSRMRLGLEKLHDQWVIRERQSGQ